MDEFLTGDELLDENFRTLHAILEQGLEEYALTEDTHAAKTVLIGIQQHFRGLKLRHDAREMLYNRLQAAFDEVNAKIDQQRRAFEIAADESFRELKPMVDQLTATASETDNIRQAWDDLAELRELIRTRQLTREQREHLIAPVQDAIGLLKLRREEEQAAFEREARSNYLQLKALVEDGLKQAEESHEYKETREYLKMIQGRFRGIRMAPDQREELWSRLQTAFDILGKRLDDFFHNKKKNWVTRMNYTLARVDADIYALQQRIAKATDDLNLLNDQLDILKSVTTAGADRATLESRIASAKHEILQAENQIRTLGREREELAQRLSQ